MEEAIQIRYIAISGEWISYQERLLPRLHRFEGLEDIYLERASGDKPGLLSHFEWGLRMKWQNWKTWKAGYSSDVNIPNIKFLDPEEFRKLVNKQPT
jgi:hypothetical protein